MLCWPTLGQALNLTFVTGDRAGSLVNVGTDRDLHGAYRIDVEVYAARSKHSSYAYRTPDPSAETTAIGDSCVLNEHLSIRDPESFACNLNSRLRHH